MTELIRLKQIKYEVTKIAMYVLFLGGLVILALGLGFKASLWVVTKLVAPEALAVYKNAYSITTQTYGKYYAEFPLPNKEQIDTDPSVPNADEPTDTTTVAVSDGIVDATKLDTFDYEAGVNEIIKELQAVETTVIKPEVAVDIIDLTISLTDAQYKDPATLILKNLGIRQLKKLASILEVKGYSNQTKDQLIASIYYKRLTMDYSEYLKIIETVQQGKEVELANDDI